MGVRARGAAVPREHRPGLRVRPVPADRLGLVAVARGAVLSALAATATPGAATRGSSRADRRCPRRRGCAPRGRAASPSPQHADHLRPDPWRRAAARRRVRTRAACSVGAGVVAGRRCARGDAPRPLRLVHERDDHRGRLGVSRGRRRGPQPHRRDTLAGVRTAALRRPDLLRVVPVERDPDLRPAAPCPGRERVVAGTARDRLDTPARGAAAEAASAREATSTTQVPARCRTSAGRSRSSSGS